MEKRYLLGIDIGGTTVKLGLFTLAGELMEKTSFKSAETAQLLIADCSRHIASLLGRRNITAGELVGAGAGVPGPVDENGVVNRCVNLGWGRVAIADELSRCCKMPVAALNDADAAALGEYWRGAGEGRHSLFMVTLGTGVGGAYIRNGKPLRGAHGSGGEIGHIQVSRDETEQCSCGLYGCLEQYSSATGIVRVAKRLLDQRAECSSLLRGEEITAKRIFELSGQDSVADEAIGIFAETLGRGMASAAAICDPEVFAIGGGVAQAGEPLRAAVEAQYRRFSFHAMREAVIALSALGSDAGIYGAAFVALDSFGR